MPASEPAPPPVERPAPSPDDVAHVEAAVAAFVAEHRLRQTAEAVRHTVAAAPPQPRRIGDTCFCCPVPHRVTDSNHRPTWPGLAIPLDNWPPQPIRVPTLDEHGNWTWP